MSLEREPQFNSASFGTVPPIHELAEQARTDFSDMSVTSHKRDRIDVDMKQAQIDIATFGEEHDIQEAINGFDALTVNKTLDNNTHIKTLNLIIEHARAASELGGVYLNGVYSVAKKIPRKNKNANPRLRTELLVELAASGKPKIRSDALKEIESSNTTPGRKAEQYQTIDKQGHENVSSRVLTQAAHDSNPIDSLEIALSSKFADGTIRPEYLLAAEEYISRIEWKNLGNNNDRPKKLSRSTDQKDYLTYMAELFRYTSKSMYIGKFNYYIHEMDESTFTTAHEKIITLTRTSDIYDNSPEDILKIGHKYATDFNPDLIYTYAAQACTAQGDVEKAADFNSSIKNRDQKLDSLEFIATRSGDTSLIDEVLDMARFLGSEEERDAQLHWLSLELLENNHLHSAYRIRNFMSNPARKINILRNVAQVYRGKQPYMPANY